MLGRERERTFVEHERARVQGSTKSEFKYKMTKKAALHK